MSTNGKASEFDDVAEQRKEVTRRHKHCVILQGTELRQIKNTDYFYCSDMESRIEDGVVEVKTTYEKCKRQGYRRASDRKIVTDNYPGLVQMYALPATLLKPTPEVIKEYELEKYFEKAEDGS